MNHSDPRFRVEIDKDGSSPKAQTAIWTKQHFCVSEDHEKAARPSEERSGQIILEHELSGLKGHWSVLDQAFVSFNCYGFPNSTMAQIRTHADSDLHVLAQSGRYTGDRFIQVATGNLDIEEVFALSPIGVYQDRLGHRYEYTQEDRELDFDAIRNACARFAVKVQSGAPYEQARESTIPNSFRQGFGCGGTLRTVFHMLDVRSKKDAQWQCVRFAELVMDRLDSYCPELAAWYRKNRFGRAITSP